MPKIARDFSRFYSIKEYSYPILGFLFGLFIAKLTDKNFDVFFWVSFAGFILFSVVVLTPFIKSQITNYTSADEIGFLEIDPIAEKFAGLKEHGGLIVGNTIEVMIHPMINSKTTISHVGWDPEKIKIEVNEKSPDFDIKFIYNYLQKSTPTISSDVKYCLIEEKDITKDNSELDYLVFQKTSYEVTKEISKVLPDEITLRQKLGNIKPALHQIPNSFCLHYITEFNDGNVLLLKRKEKLDYYPNKFSISGEEQLSAVDFRSGNLLNLFKRALVEEVFPLNEKYINLDKENTEINEMWEKISPYVKTTKVFSLFYEEEISNFAVMGYFLINISIKEFKDLSQKFLAQGGHRDNEGSLYYTSLKNLMALHFARRCEIYSMKTDQPSQLAKSDLHPTSKYRLFRFLRMKNEGPLTLTDFLKDYDKSFEVA